MDSVQTQDKEGNWVDAVPIGPMCEHLGCNNAVTLKDQYVREDKNLPNGWGDEPECLCPEHAVGRTLVETENNFVEEVWFLFGIRIFNLFFGFTVYQNSGEVAHVDFNWKKAFSFLPFLKDSNKFLIGFYHTHPGGDPYPSSTDTETMGTWVKAMGKPMLAGIKSGNDQRCYLYKRTAEDSSDIKYKRMKSVWFKNFFCGRYHEGR